MGVAENTCKPRDEEWSGDCTLVAFNRPASLAVAARSRLSKRPALLFIVGSMAAPESTAVSAPDRSCAITAPTAQA